jgi:Domain of unknown function (DUF4282)
MAGHAASQGRPDNSGQAAYGVTGRGSHASGGTAGAGFDPPTTAMRHSAGRTTESKGFLGSLFDIGFTSFGTPKVIKALYVLIITGTIISALFYAYIAFTMNVALGILTLFVFAPVCTLIILALWRITLEFFMIIFRISDDIRAVCGRSEFR